MPSADWPPFVGVALALGQADWAGPMLLLLRASFVCTELIHLQSVVAVPASGRFRELDEREHLVD